VITKDLYIYALSLAPLFEGRYAIIIGAELGVTPLKSLFIASLGVFTLSILLPKLIEVIDFVLMRFADSRYGILKKVGNIYLKYVNNVMKRRGLVERYGFLGLIVFVAIPLPATGMWTGSLLGMLLRMSRMRLFLALLLGGLVSNLITFSLTYLAISIHF
jgi:uncharacterized membrane protein